MCFCSDDIGSCALFLITVHSGSDITMSLVSLVVVFSNAKCEVKKIYELGNSEHLLLYITGNIANCGHPKRFGGCGPCNNGVTR